MKIDISKLVTKEDKLAQERLALIDTIAARRFDAEVAGVDIDGMQVYSDRTTQMKLTSASIRAQRSGDDYTVDWKCTDGTFIKLSGEQIMRIGDVVGDYIQSCYTREAELVELSKETGFDVSDIETGWPSNKLSIK